ncbi:MAG TPA: polysaccharide deacetylase family protein [Burkholderiaceae bacterium]|nr:polysaccharide deacetylase family protein [Burkholderiaceae bacterium]
MQGERRAATPPYKLAIDETLAQPQSARTRAPSWRPTPLIALSFAVHGAAGALAVLAPPLWPWALGAVAANHAVLTALGLWPRSSLLGPNLVRLPASAMARREVALTFDDGPDPDVTPRVLDLLDAAGARASFFCIGRRARQYPALVREVAARGHRVENHGDKHSKAFGLYGYNRMRADVAAAQATLADLTGQAPRFFRPLGGVRSPILDPVLARLDLRLACWTRRGFDSVQGNPQGVYGRLVRGLAPGDILLLHDGSVARTPAGEAVSVAVLPRLLAAMRDAQVRSVTLVDAVS